MHLGHARPCARFAQFVAPPRSRGIIHGPVTLVDDDARCLGNGEKRGKLLEGGAVPGLCPEREDAGLVAGRGGALEPLDQRNDAVLLGPRRRLGKAGAAGQLANGFIGSPIGRVVAVLVLIVAMAVAGARGLDRWG